MPSLTITTRQTTSGPRYVVRYRLGGRAYPVQHAGSFKTMREAKARRDLVGGELAAGRNPAELLDQLAHPVAVLTLRDVWPEFVASRVDANTARHERMILPALGDLQPGLVTFQDVQRWASGATCAASSLRRYLGTLRLLLDYAGVDPNPARDRRLRLPRVESEIPSPPSRREVEAIIANVAPRMRLGLEVLAATGMRVGELAALEWQDVDVAESRFRIRRGKTKAARRWVAVPPELLMRVSEQTPPDDRTPERRVFYGTEKAIGNAMARACKAAGTACYSPHDLRHRWISLMVKRGVPITEISAAAGHSRSSITLDTYAHVMLEEEA